MYMVCINVIRVVIVYTVIMWDVLCGVACLCCGMWRDVFLRVVMCCIMTCCVVLRRVLRCGALRCVAMLCVVVCWFALCYCTAFYGVLYCITLR